MKLLRAVLARLDPWAAIVLGVLVALGVVILLATPGPWHKVVGPPPTVDLAPPSPTDLALYALTGPRRQCEAVVWVHVDHEFPSVTAVSVAPPTQGFLAGAGFMPLAKMVDAAGPAAATTALGQAVGVHMDAWLTLDDEALRIALSAVEPAGSGSARVTQYRAWTAAWDGTAGPSLAWRLQTTVLTQAMLRVPWSRTSIIGFANYVLGFGHIRTDMDLQQATSLATTLKHLPPSQAGACAVAALVETCRAGEAWRVDPQAAAALRRELAAGGCPQPAPPLVTRAPVPARVLVVLPGRRPAARAYVDEVRRRLAASAGAPVAVEAITVNSWPRLAARTVAAARAWRPLAVLVGPPVVPAAADAEEVVASLRVLGVALRANSLPAVVSQPLPAETTGTVAPEAAVLGAAVAASRQPLSPVAASAETTASVPAPLSATATARRVARANAATLVRACWPAVLAPHLASTRLGFSFAARRRTEVAVVSADPGRAASYAARLRTCGFQARQWSGGAWTPPQPGRGVFYRPGERRAAVSLAGDLGLPVTAVVADPGGPAPVTLSVP